MANFNIPDLTTTITGATLDGADTSEVYDATGTVNAKITQAELAKGLDPLAKTAVTTPLAAPSSGEMKTFPFTRAGFTRPAYRNADGLFQSLQTALYGFNNVWWMPTHNSTTVSTNGISLNYAGTVTAAAVNSSALATYLVRLEYLVTVASSSAVAGYRLATGSWGYIRGTSAKIGGFYMVLRWGPTTGVATATARAFAGTAGIGTLIDVDPSSLLNVVGMGWDAADTQVQIMHNDGAGTCTKIPLGASWPRPTSDRTAVYEIHVYAPPNSSNIYYTALDLVNDLEASGTITTNIPSTTTGMVPYAYTSVGGTSSVTGITMYGTYIGTYY